MGEKTIYELKFHESLQLEDFEITRVAGGWVYRYWDYAKKIIMRIQPLFLIIMNLILENQIQTPVPW